MKIFKIILPALLLLKINNCFAQKDSTGAAQYDRFYISLTGGVGIPVGDFAHINKDIFQTGFDKPWPVSQNLAEGTKSGIAGKLSASYFFLKNLGCTGAMSQNSFKTENKTVSDFKGFHLQDYFKDSEYLFDAKRWKTNAYMFGLIARFASEKLAFNIRFLVGSQRTESPEINLIWTQDFPPYVVEKYTVTQLSATSAGFAWNPGFDFQVKITKKIGALISADYISSKAVFSGKDLIIDEYTETGSGGSNVRDYDFILPFEHKKKISYFSLTAGIAYTFK